jgi:hypothetical protein
MPRMAEQAHDVLHSAATRAMGAVFVSVKRLSPER